MSRDNLCVTRRFQVAMCCIFGSEYMIYYYTEFEDMSIFAYDVTNYGTQPYTWSGHLL
jgi:hypothetical protein